MSGMENLPLPSGWEAKFSAQANRYFFINHADKSTSWVDPRTMPQYQQQLQQQFTPHPWAPAQAQPRPHVQPQPAPTAAVPAATHAAHTQHHVPAQQRPTTIHPPQDPLLCSTCKEMKVNAAGEQCWKCLARELVGSDDKEEDDEAASDAQPRTRTMSGGTPVHLRPGVKRALFKKLSRGIP
ncbi:PREDICTED: transcriptional coactivator YAP1-like [Priapulus caudatus]|uniref:Transcriptional coactivator YAP1-like n=1 Tax=Priapulus caudatus TaxID=37621 RepID=A0ABM1F2K3_PRICU|nr:PREDICTED: transcriptional coactivator YAP1-like [Priapulus caudatus]